MTARTRSPRSSRARTRGRTTTTRGGRPISTSRSSGPSSPSACSPSCTSRATRCSRSTRSTSRSPIDQHATAWSRPMTTASPSTSSSWATTGTSCSPEPTGAGWKKTTMTDLTATPDLTPPPGQTVGRFYGCALRYDRASALGPAGSARAGRLHGVVYDGGGGPVPEAVLEIWQPDENGTVPRATGSRRRGGFTFTGFGRAAVGPEGEYSFSTVDPGPTEPGKAAFISVVIFARGLLNGLFTRIYLPEDTEA